jgi:hypothetical protein
MYCEENPRHGISLELPMEVDAATYQNLARIENADGG